MAKQPRKAESATGTPQSYPQTTPEAAGALGRDHSFTLQVVMELQRSVGQLQEAVEHLAESNKDHAGKLDKLSHRVYAAMVVLAIAGAILSPIGDKIWYLIGSVAANDRITAAAPLPPAPPAQ